MMEQMEDCMDEVEIITSPSYSVFTSSTQPTINLVDVPVVYHFFISETEIIEPSSLARCNALEPPPPEFYIQYQSFLC